MDSPEPPLAKPVMQLPYADLPARHGIIFQRGEGRCMIAVPVPFWHQLFFAGSSGMILAFFVHPLVGLFLVLVVCGIALSRLWPNKPMVFELTPTELSIDNAVPGTPQTFVRYDRAAVYDVKYVAHSNRIVIHAHGHQMLELYPSSDKKVLEWIAETLRAELWPPTSPRS